VKAGSEGIRKLVNVIVPVNFNGLFGGIQYHVALMAPMQVLVQFSLKVFGYLPVQVIGKFL
jgi:hypothetical protein